MAILLKRKKRTPKRGGASKVSLRRNKTTGNYTKKRKPRSVNETWRHLTEKDNTLIIKRATKLQKFLLHYDNYIDESKPTVMFMAYLTDIECVVIYDANNIMIIADGKQDEYGGVSIKRILYQSDGFGDDEYFQINVKPILAEIEQLKSGERSRVMSRFNEVVNRLKMYRNNEHRIQGNSNSR
jgi:hypothetical protein